MRINLYSGPGAGKSVTCSWLFSQLKIKKYNIEQIHEFVKTWAYLKRQPKSFDQCYIFGKQLHREDVVLQSGVEHVITDCPILMHIPYCVLYGSPAWKSLVEIYKEFEKKYPSIHIFLDRSNIDYQELGRYQNYDEALLVDGMIKLCLNSYCDYVVMDVTKSEEILAYIESRI